MEPYAVLAFFALMAAVGWLAAGRRRHRRTTSPAWRRVAKRLGGVLRAPDKTPAVSSRPRSDTLHATVKGIRVTAELAEIEEDHVVSVVTRLRAAADGAKTCPLRVSRRDVVSAIDRILGGAAMATGDRSFDGQFVVQSSRPRLARLWLDGPLRRAIAASTSYSFSVEGGQAEATMAGRDDDERRLVAAMTAVARLARRGQVLSREWRRLGDELGGAQAAGEAVWPAIEIEAGGVPVSVTVDVESKAEAAAGTQVATKPLGRQRERFALGRQLPPWSAGLEPVSALAVPLAGRSAVSEAPSATAAWLERNADDLAATDPDSLSYDGQLLSLGFDDIVFDPARLKRAVGLIATLGARDERGPYR